MPFPPIFLFLFCFVLFFCFPLCAWARACNFVCVRVYVLTFRSFFGCYECRYERRLAVISEFAEKQAAISPGPVNISKSRALNRRTDEEMQLGRELDLRIVTDKQRLQRQQLLGENGYRGGVGGVDSVDDTGESASVVSLPPEPLPPAEGDGYTHSHSHSHSHSQSHSSELEEKENPHVATNAKGTALPNAIRKRRTNNRISTFGPHPPKHENATLEQERKLHDELATDMVEMAQELKAKVLLLQKSMREESSVLDETDALLEDNLGQTDGTNAKLSAHMAASTRGTMQIYCTLFLVMVVFFATYLFMKIFPSPR